MSVTTEAPAAPADTADPHPSSEVQAEEPEVVGEPTVPAQHGAEQPAESDDRAEEKADAADDKTKAKPRCKTAPRKAAATKALVVLRDGRVHYCDAETVVVVDLDEAASPDTDVHDVLDRLTELRDAAECPGKAEAVKALTDLIQEKALG